MPTFGHMWFDALGWQPEEDGRHLIDPQTLPFAVHCHESELGGSSTNTSPLVRMARLNESAHIAHESVSPPEPVQSPTRTRGLRISPHQLDKAAICPSCYLQLMRLGLTPDAVSQHTSSHSTPSAAERIGLPPANVIGSIFHRVIEIGLENPGLQSEISVPLQPQWTEKSANLLDDDDVIQSALDELLPPNADVDAMKSLLKQMSKAVINGPLGTLTSGLNWNGEIVEGLRTEWPFSLQHTLDISADDQSWTPHGPHRLANIERFIFSSTGITDLVLCTRLDDGSGAIRAIDFKTTGAAHLHAGWAHPLLEAEGDSRHESEQEMLDDYRMQLALYTLTLLRQEQARERAGIPFRKVLPPAILSTTTGRMIVMTEDEMDAAIEELATLLQQIAELALQDELEQDCNCSLNLSNIRLFSESTNESE